MAEQSTKPPYSEEQATRWLAWLAYNIRQRDLNIFQIEELQPNWLVGRREVATHLFLAHILWGVFWGLFFSVISALISSLSVGLSDSLSVGLSVGLIYGLAEFFIPIYKFDLVYNPNTLAKDLQIETLLQGQMNSLTKKALISTVVQGLIGGLIGFLIGGLSDTVRVGLIVGLMFGASRATRVIQYGADNYIRTVESLHWSGQKIKMRMRRFLIITLCLVPSFILTSDPIYSQLDKLILALIFFLSLMVLSGFQIEPQSMKTRPNQGIWLTIQSALTIGPAIGGICYISMWLFFNFTTALSSGIVFTILFGLLFGGINVIEHAIIRLIIAWRGHAPLNYARFLDYAANELNFLQKVSGGYVFIHRYLLEHFAELAVERGYVDVNARRHPQSF